MSGAVPTLPHAYIECYSVRHRDKLTAFNRGKKAKSLVKKLIFFSTGIVYMFRLN